MYTLYTTGVDLNVMPKWKTVITIIIFFFSFCYLCMLHLQIRTLDDYQIMQLSEDKNMDLYGCC